MQEIFNDIYIALLLAGYSLLKLKDNTTMYLNKGNIVVSVFIVDSIRRKGKKTYLVNIGLCPNTLRVKDTTKQWVHDESNFVELLNTLKDEEKKEILRTQESENK